jgi:hypothetical protein
MSRYAEWAERAHSEATRIRVTLRAAAFFVALCLSASFRWMEDRIATRLTAR